MYIIFLCFSRDKTNLNNLITDDSIKIILQNAGLTQICEGEQIACTIGKIEKLILYNSCKYASRIEAYLFNKLMLKI